MIRNTSGLAKLMKRAPDNVRYLGQFGEHILTRSFTALDPQRSEAERKSRGAAVSARTYFFTLLQKICCKRAGRCWHSSCAMTYLLPPLNPLRAFEATARHLSFKFAARELHVTPGAVGQQVKVLEDRLGVRLFERLHKQLVLTAAGQEYVTSVQKAFYRIADATERLKPQGVATVLSVGVYARFDLGGRLGPDRFRAAHPAIGLRIMEPAGLQELVEGA